jgi:hypothetical protein
MRKAEMVVRWAFRLYCVLASGASDQRDWWGKNGTALKRMSDCLAKIRTRVRTQRTVVVLVQKEMEERNLKGDKPAGEFLKQLQKSIDESMINDRSARSSSLVNIALCSFIVLGLCSIGSHSESLEYDRRVFGYYASLKEGVGER